MLWVRRAANSYSLRARRVADVLQEVGPYGVGAVVVGDRRVGGGRVQRKQPGDFTRLPR